MQAPPGSSILYHDLARLSFSFLFFTSIILLFCFLPFISIFPFVFPIKKKNFIDYRTIFYQRGIMKRERILACFIHRGNGKLFSRMIGENLINFSVSSAFNPLWKKLIGMFSRLVRKLLKRTRIPPHFLSSRWLLSMCFAAFNVPRVQRSLKVNLTNKSKFGMLGGLLKQLVQRRNNLALRFRGD